jgi:exosortase/archaeosortase family protein
VSKKARGGSRPSEEERGAKSPVSPGQTAEFRRFVLRFLGSLLLFSVIVTVTAVQNHLWPLEYALAFGAEMGGKVAQVDVTRTGNSLSVGGFRLEINHECTAFFVLLIYASFLLAYPATIKERLRGLVLGVSVLMGVNVLRLVGLVIVVDIWPRMFDYFHEYFFQVLFLGLITALAHRWLGTLAGQRDLLAIPR